MCNERTQFSTPALDLIKVLHSSRLKVSRYRDWSKHVILNPSTVVGSGAYSIVEASRHPGVVIKRTRYSQNSDVGQALHAERNLEQLTSELRILMSDRMRSSNLFVKVMGVCYEDSVNRSEAGYFHMLLEHSKLGDMASFLRCNGQQLDTKSKVELMHHVASGLALLHLEQICHGDLKVQNVLMFKSKRGGYVAKLADFGISAYPEYRGEVDILAYPSRVVRYPPGTLLLNAPEIRESNLNIQSVDITAIIRADIFSFGLLVWETIKNGESYFNIAWLDNRILKSEVGVEEKLSFLSSLPPNGLLSRCEEFLLAQDLNDQHHQQILRTVRGSLQDEPLQRQPMSHMCEKLSTLDQNERWNAMCSHSLKIDTDFNS